MPRNTQSQSPTGNTAVIDVLPTSAVPTAPSRVPNADLESAGIGARTRPTPPTSLLAMAGLPMDLGRPGRCFATLEAIALALAVPHFPAHAKESWATAAGRIMAESRKGTIGSATVRAVESAKLAEIATECDLSAREAASIVACAQVHAAAVKLTSALAK